MEDQHKVNIVFFQLIRFLGGIWISLPPAHGHEEDTLVQQGVILVCCSDNSPCTVCTEGASKGDARILALSNP